MTDAQWRCLEPLLPPGKPSTGRPNKDHRRILDGLLWIGHTGTPWCDLPERQFSVEGADNHGVAFRRLDPGVGDGAACHAGDQGLDVKVWLFAELRIRPADD